MSCLGKIDERAAVRVRLPIIGNTIGSAFNPSPSSPSYGDFLANYVAQGGGDTLIGAGEYQVASLEDGTVPDDGGTLPTIVVTAQRPSLWQTIVNFVVNTAESFTSESDSTTNYYANAFQMPIIPASPSLRRAQQAFQTNQATVTTPTVNAQLGVGALATAGLGVTGGLGAAYGAGALALANTASLQASVSVPLAVPAGTFAIGAANTFFTGSNPFGAVPPLAAAAETAAPGVDLALTYKPGWTAAQMAEADAKVQILDQADTVVTSVNRSGTSAASRYASEGGDLVPGSDIDHTVDLQLGGSDTVSNMLPLNSSVNRSLGAQIQQQIKGLPAGTVINRVTIGPR